MQVDRLVSLEALCENVFCRRLLPFAAVLLMVLAQVWAFLVTPDEQVMGAVQRIMYFHVGAAVAVYLMLGLLLAASICYLTSNKPQWDAVSVSAVSVAFVFASAVLCSGMIWAHSSWNTWWRWEPRLVSFLILWLMLFSYGILREFSAEQRRTRRFCAVLGILFAAYVPLAMVAVRLPGFVEQLHPQRVVSQGLLDWRFKFALLFGVLALISLGLWLFIVKLTNQLLSQRLEQLEQER